MSNFKKVTLAKEARVELHDLLGLTRCEISVNSFPANVKGPAHHHFENEELYLVLDGSGENVIDGQSNAITAGDAIKVDPKAVRAVNSGANGIKYICVQAKAGSLTQFTANDAAFD